jgi:putative heme-binding domain-containing protein
MSNLSVRCALLSSLLAGLIAGEATPVVPHLFLPGFTIRELPITLTSLNNIEYAPDGRLFAGGYDGRFHVLRDHDGDGLEEEVTTFAPTATPDYPLGMLVHDGALYTVLTDQVVRFRDADGDGVPETRETVVKGFDDPELVAAAYLNHRRVDSSMAIAIGPDGALYVTMGNAGYNNPYWKDKQGVAHYATDKRRGCLLRFGKDGSVTQLNSGLRYIMSLQFNRHGDLFGSDQEGATWVPNGNPFDELLHIEQGRHYGFPPRHPQFLPDVIDEPSVYDYTPQHQSTCGFRFNGPLPGRGRFGPESWADDAFMTGAARGKLWRTALAKTATGYVAHTQLFADFGLLAVDCAISPTGDLVVCCHTGAPDWGNGPKGAGRVFKLSLQDQTVPQPVATWAASPTQTVIAFDRPVAAAWATDLAARTRVVAGRFIDAGDHLEAMRPGYAVVKRQQAETKQVVAVTSAKLGTDGRSVVLDTAARTVGQNYAITIGGAGGGQALDLAHDLTGVAATWRGADGAMWDGWLPHIDPLAARVFTRGSAMHDELWAKMEKKGTLTLRGQLDLWQMLIPETQPGSTLDYTPEPEQVHLGFRADSGITFESPGVVVAVGDANMVRASITAPQAGRWLPFTLTLATPVRKLSVSYSTSRDPRERAFATRRILLPFATPSATDAGKAVIPEIAGGNWQAGRDLYKTKAMCALCHQLRGDGNKVGPDLANVIHRDYASVLKDISEPNATINPDAIAYQVTSADGSVVIGTRLGETADELQIAQPGGIVAKLKKSQISKTEALATSLMPPGLDKTLSATELRDLMTYLLTEAPR